MHNPHSVLLTVDQSPLPTSKDLNNDKADYKVQKTLNGSEFLDIPITCFDMNNNNNASPKPDSSRPSDQSSSSAIDQDAANLPSADQSSGHQSDAHGDLLEPRPFRDGTILEVTSDIQASFASAGGLVFRPSMVPRAASLQWHQDQNESPQASPGEDVLQSSWMATVDRIIRSTPMESFDDHDPSSSSKGKQKRSAEGSLPSQRKRARRGNVALKSPPSASNQKTKATRFRDYQNDAWSQQYEALLEFKQKHGHCHVPHTYEDNPSLSRWAKRQRYQYKRKLENKQSSMSDARQQKLDDVGFVWDLQTMVWQERFNELVEYKKIHGDCNVPCRFEENPTLGMWVKCQRRQYKLFRSGQLSRLTPERFQLLTNMGFTWEPQNVNANKKLRRAD